MPIASYPGSPDPRNDTKPEIVADKYESNLIDTKEWVGVDIATQLDGSPWTVDFYHQVLGKNQSPSAPQPEQPDVYQQYRVIKRFELMVTSPLSNRQIPETGSFEVTGEANIYPGLVPMQYDVFVAGAPDGQLALFVITDVERLTIFKRSAYTIRYVQKSFANVEWRQFLADRVVETLHYRKDYLRNGRFPFLTTDQEVTSENIFQIRSDLIDRLNREFYNPRVYGFPIPGQAKLTYDPFLAEAWRDIVSYTRDYQYRDVVVQNMSGSNWDRAITFWTVLFKRHRWIPDLLTKRVAVVSTLDTSNDPTLFSIRYTLYQACLVPTEWVSFPGATGVMDPYHGWTLEFDPQLEPSAQNEEAPSEPEPTPDPYPSEDPPIMNPVVDDEYYVFSKAFYDGDVPYMSLVERQVHLAVHNKAMDLSVLLRINDELSNLAPLERYYATAVLYCLLAIHERH